MFQELYNMPEMWICPNIILSVIIVVILKCYVSQQTPNFLINFTIMNHIFNNEYLNIPLLTGSYYFTQILLQKFPTNVCHLQRNS